MFFITWFVLALLLLILLYRRYVPVFGVPCRKVNEAQIDENDILVDIRDYSASSRNPVNGSLHIPAAYLNRYASEIPGDRVLVIASDRLEKNWGIRELRKKGIKVVAYTLDGCGCQ